jgi:hypothetical protein
MSIEDTLNAFKAYGGAVRWGSGLLGKSAFVVGPLVVGLMALAWESHSDLVRFGFALLAVGSFFGWYVPFLNFCEKHPADALLDGEHWAAHQQFIAAKGHPEGLTDIGLRAPVAGAIAPRPVAHDGEQKA